jgi:hypothetical protein
MTFCSMNIAYFAIEFFAVMGEFYLVNRNEENDC